MTIALVLSKYDQGINQYWVGVWFFLITCGFDSSIPFKEPHCFHERSNKFKINGCLISDHLNCYEGYILKLVLWWNVVGAYYLRFGIRVHPTLSTLENWLWFTEKHYEAIYFLCMKKPTCMEDVFINIRCFHLMARWGFLSCLALVSLLKLQMTGTK
jgi:hypothetical protein